MIQSYLWLKIAVNDPVRPHQLQRGEHLGSETPNQSCCKSAEIVGLDQLVQVDAEKLGDDAQMTAEIEMVRHPNHVMFVLWVLPMSAMTKSGCHSVRTNPFTKLLQNLDFNQGLRMETFFVSDNFDRNGLSTRVISGLDDLSE